MAVLVFPARQHILEDRQLGPTSTACGQRVMQSVWGLQRFALMTRNSTFAISITPRNLERGILEGLFLDLYPKGHGCCPLKFMMVISNLLIASMPYLR